LTLHKLALSTVSYRAFVYCISCRVVARSFLVATTLYNGIDVVVFKPFNIAIFRTAPPVSPPYVLLHVVLYVSKRALARSRLLLFRNALIGALAANHTLKFPAQASSTIMLAAEHYLDFFADSTLLPKKRAFGDSSQQNLAQPCKNWLQLSDDSAAPSVLNVCRAVVAYLSNGARWSTCLPRCCFKRTQRKRVRNHRIL
jgi:hypothetical protein